MEGRKSMSENISLYIGIVHVPQKRCVAKEWRKKVRLAKVAKEKAIKSKRAAARWRKNGCIYVCIRGISRDRGEGVKQCHFLWVTM